MPKIKHAGLIKKLESASAFSFRTVEASLGRDYAKVFIHNLKKSGRITVLRKGWYTFRNSPYLITIPLGEAYVGLGSAASLYNAWDQANRIDILTTKAPKNIRAGERYVAGMKVVIRRISRDMYFGFSPMIVDGNWIRVSEPEKTLIDMIYYDYPFLDEIFPNLLKKIDKKRLREHAGRMKSARGYRKVRKFLSNITCV